MSKLKEITDECNTMAADRKSSPEVKRLAAVVALAAEVGLLDHRNAASTSHRQSPPENINEI